MNERVGSGKQASAIFFAERTYYKRDCWNIFDVFAEIGLDQRDHFGFEVDIRAAASLRRTVKHKRHVVVGSEFFNESAHKDVDARSEHSIGDREELERPSGHAWKSQRSSSWTENLSIESARDNPNLAPFHAGRREKFTVKFSRDP